MTVAAYGNFHCRRQRWQQMTMALNDDRTRELVADDDGQETRQDGEQRWHSVFIRGNNC